MAYNRPYVSEVKPGSILYYIGFEPYKGLFPRHRYVVQPDMTIIGRNGSVSLRKWVLCGTNSHPFYQDFSLIQ